MGWLRGCCAVLQNSTFSWVGKAKPKQLYTVLKELECHSRSQTSAVFSEHLNQSCSWVETPFLSYQRACVWRSCLILLTSSARRKRLRPWGVLVRLSRVVHWQTCTEGSQPRTAAEQKGDRNCFVKCRPSRVRISGKVRCKHQNCIRELGTAPVHSNLLWLLPLHPSAASWLSVPLFLLSPPPSLSMF